MNDSKPPLAVVGVGNILCSDEGVGIHVIKYLEKLDLPPYVSLYDCGTSGIAVLEALDGVEKGILIDAVAFGGSPGKIYRFLVTSLLEMEDSLFKLVSLHQLDLITIFRVSYMTKTYRMPEDIVIYGVEGENFDLGMELSRPVSDAVPKLIGMIIEEIESFGEGLGSG
jgi:hydrogenase maturation protease